MERLLKDDATKAWKAHDSKTLCAIVNEYFLHEFNAYSTLQISDYLTTDNLEELHRRAEPLFGKSAYYNLSSAARICHLSYPEVAPIPRANIDNFLSMHRTSIAGRETWINNRISIINLYAGVPLEGYEFIECKC